MKSGLIELFFAFLSLSPELRVMSGFDEPNEPLPVLPPSPTESDSNQLDEKEAVHKSPADSADVDIVGGKERYSDGGSHDDTKLDTDDTIQYVNGEPVITTGRDVSRYLVDARDDGDPPITFRSLFLGTVFAGLGASLYQVC